MRKKNVLKKIFAMTLATGLCFGNSWNVLLAEEQPIQEEQNIVEENSNVNTQAEPQPLAEVQGDGFTWDEGTKTLTITSPSVAKDNIDSSIEEQVTSVVVNTSEDIVDGAFEVLSGQNRYKNVSELNIIHAGNIGNEAFLNWGNSGKLTRNITIGECGSIGADAFKRLNGAGGTLTINQCGDISKNAFSSSKISGPVTIENCGNIDTWAFGNTLDNKVTSLKIGTCGSINDDAFSSFKDSLETAEINSISGDITGDLFARFSVLKSLKIGECGDIPKDSIGFAPSLETLEIGKCGILEGQSQNKLKKIKIGKCESIGNFSNLQPQNVESLEVLEIGKCGSIADNAFQNAENLKTIKIDEIAVIGQMAFQWTSNLSSIEIGSCDEIKNYAFWGAGSSGNMENIVLDSVKLGENSFYSSKTKNLVISNSKNIPNYTIPSQAFASSTIEHITLSNVSKLESESFAYLKNLQTLTIQDMDVIGENSFRIEDDDVNQVTTINLTNVKEISDYAFENFKNLETVNLDESCLLVGAHAFSGCEKLQTINIPETTKLGYSDSFVKQEYIKDRVQKELYGQFNLVEEDQTISTITPEGWTSSKVGKNNKADTVYGDTQLTKEAKWNDVEKTVADVLVKAYYTTNQQMDFVFVADCSNSMAGFGSSDAKNSNFYNMQSKMMDVSEKLLNAYDSLDTRVAFSTFGETPEQTLVSDFFEKGDSATDYIWNDIVNYESNTNYSNGLAGALELVNENKDAGRNTTVIFISDGQPYGEDPIPEDYYGAAQAQAIKEAGANLICVLQQVPEGTLASSQENMAKLSDTVFSSTDLASFSNAVNSAVEYAYSSYTLTDVIHPDFELIEDSIQVSEGTTYEVGKDEKGNTTITWKITGVPFTELNLSFQQKLKQKDGAYPYGDFDTNLGDALLNDSTNTVNQVETPVLSRENPNKEDPNKGQGEDTGLSTGIGLFASLGTSALAGAGILEALKRKNRK